MSMKRREFLAAGLGLNVASVAAPAQQSGATTDRAAGGRGAVPTRSARTTRMFKSPGLYPNALAVMTDAPGGLWIGQQKVTAQNAVTYNLPLDPDRDEVAWLVDWNGKLLRTVKTHSRNTSGMAYGNGCVWMGANAEPFGIFQVDLDSKQISHRQIPLSIDGNGGGCHGVKWHNGKLWIAALRLGGILRVDPTTWVPEALIRVSSQEKPRLHDAAFDNDGNIWVVTERRQHTGTEARLNKCDGKSGQLLTVVSRPDRGPAGLVWHDDTVRASTGMVRISRAGYIFIGSPSTRRQ
jgi:hypothetical protein